MCHIGETSSGRLLLLSEHTATLEGERQKVPERNDMEQKAMEIKKKAR